MTESELPRTPPPSERGPKPEVSGATKVLNVKIKDQQEAETIFKIKSTTKFSKIFEAYGERRSIDIRYIRFLLRGTRIQKDETPASLEMEDGEEIQAMIEMQGGDGTPALDLPNPDSLKNFNVKAVDRKQNEVFFTIKENTPLKEVMDVYCERQGIMRDSVRFLLEGERITNGDTPLSMEMENEDIIEVVEFQIGGNSGDETPGNKNTQPKDEGANNRLNIKLVDQNNHEVIFQVKLNTKMEKVMNAFADQKGQNVGSLRFFTADGKRVLPTSTPGSLELENEDVIDVHLFQEGGTSQEDEEPKEEKPQNHITLRVKMDVGSIQTYKVKKTTAMSKLMDAYCKHLGRAPNTLRFFTPDGKRIQADDNPATLQLEDDDLLDAHEEQQGGTLQEVGSTIGHQINIKVMEFSSQQVVYFKMSTTTRIAKLIAAYEDREGLSPDSAIFSVAGMPIKKHDTPMSLHLQDGATIRVDLPQGFRANDRITFCVKDVLGTELWVKTRLERSMDVVMDFYRNHVGEPGIRFETASGSQIQATDTPLSLGLLEGGCVNCSYIDLGQVAQIFQESLGITEL